MDKQFEKLDSETRVELENVLKFTIVDQFRQDAIAYFILRAIMRMHSEEVKSYDEI